MPPKPAAAGDEESQMLEQTVYMKKKIEILQHRIMYKQDQASKSRQSEEELRGRIRELDVCFQQEADRCRENTAEMSRQYREMQESFNEKIKVLQKAVADAKNEIETVKKDIERVRSEKDEIIRQKDAEVNVLSHKMETMAFEFADMLKETLDKMSQRIEVTHNSWDRKPGKPPLMNQLKAFSLNDGPPGEK
eukprot:CAMPEP_0206464378 /NCGR_PEP_ID=MMETSP0324_2-20121206/27181_1 /ASSEMBLY_ACC=CAM_ASM_000836 /TAXON_ID=2866 /ORGANISM="Crypthecodinium cohnii, Strain Seligo" /LENGTH=191 /DNA_ID=CAMNT_0053936999 /DNA_START=75 /DNA_END=650 /DNA_ORIENTATION=+